MSKQIHFLRKDLHKRLDFFKSFRPPGMRPYGIWILGTSCILLVLFFVFEMVGKKQVQECTCLEKEVASLNDAVINLNEKIKQVFEENNKRKNIEIKIAKFETNKKLLQNIFVLLSSISKTIPKNTWIEKISLEENSGKTGKGKGKKMLHVVLDGGSLQEEEVFSFSAKLGQNGVISDVVLNNFCLMNHNQNEQGSKSYEFQLIGLFFA